MPFTIQTKRSVTFATVCEPEMWKNLDYLGTNGSLTFLGFLKKKLLGAGVGGGGVGGYVRGINS